MVFMISSSKNRAFPHSAEFVCDSEVENPLASSAASQRPAGVGWPIAATVITVKLRSNSRDALAGTAVGADFAARTSVN